MRTCPSASCAGYNSFSFAQMIVSLIVEVRRESLGAGKDDPDERQRFKLL